jgi:molybdopterin-guanine dinucleotide biosynthesis protein A
VSESAAPTGRPVSAAIVAGGANERFGGEPKGLRTVGGLRLIDRVVAAVRTVTHDLVLIANAPDAEKWLPRVPVRRDARTERGSVVGIHSALVGARDIVLVVAWDMPFVSADLLAAIVRRARAGASAVVPEGRSGPEPFCAAYTAECLPAIEDAIVRGEYRMSSLVARLPGVVRLGSGEVSAFGDPTRLFFNVNTPADWKTAEQMAAAG